MQCSASCNIDAQAFTRLAYALARDMDADMLLSAPGHVGETASIIGVRPKDELLVTLDTPPSLLKNFSFGDEQVLGFVSYTYGLKLRGIATDKETDFPHGCLRKYEALIRYDATSQSLQVQADNDKLLSEIMRLAENPPELPEPAIMPKLPIVQSLNQDEYEAGVEQTLEKIRDGWTYQLNLSTMFERSWPGLDALALFFRLFTKNPAPFYGWFSVGSYRVLSTSPERFLKVENGDVLSQPIKGTMHVDSDDPALVEQLQSSPKEDAELSMIVDLIRNDISTNCEYGSVKVEDHKAVFRVDNLLQMHSKVLGKLRKGSDCLDLFLDAFPGGSITGCPKLSSMEIIEELEPHSRDIYCGSLLHIENEQNMDSSIAIRTAVYDTRSEMLRWYAGSGIVVDSNPHAEYLETLAKAEKFLMQEDE